jgi:hypothetical protein
MYWDIPINPYFCIRVLIHTMVVCPEGLAIAKPFWVRQLRRLAWEFFDILIKVQKDMSALRLTTSESRPSIVRMADGTTKWYKAWIVGQNGLPSVRWCNCARNSTSNLPCIQVSLQAPSIRGDATNLIHTHMKIYSVHLSEDGLMTQVYTNIKAL